MQEFIDTSCAPNGVDIPVPTVQEKLWDLDVDDDLWANLTWHGVCDKMQDEPSQVNDRGAGRTMLTIGRVKGGRCSGL